MAFPIGGVGATELTLLAQQLSALGPRAALMAKITTEEMAERAEDKAKELVPYRTGHLHDTIKAELHPGGLGFDLMAEADYAGFVEYGTPRMPPQPYIRPAIDSVTRLGVSTMNSMMRRLL